MHFTIKHTQRATHHKKSYTTHNTPKFVFHYVYHFFFYIFVCLCISATANLEALDVSTTCCARRYDACCQQSNKSSFGHKLSHMLGN